MSVLATGADMHDLMRRLYPLPRSISGEAVRESLRILQESVPLQIQEIVSGSRVLDWVVPDEWNPKSAYISTISGDKIIDFENHNLHLMSYSVAVDAILSLDELRGHLHYLSDQPDAIPYRTGYYSHDWGFCLSYNQMQALEALGAGPYRVVIDASRSPGVLNYGELVIPGETDDEVLLSTNLCHPSMANNELSGMVMLAALAAWLGSRPRRLTYRILWLPETIGAVAYLARHGDHLRQKVVAGWQVVCVGGPQDFAYVSSRLGDALPDRMTSHVMRHMGIKYRHLDYSYRGSDERQWCWPGNDLPLGSLTKTKYHDYPEYHTSLDDLDFVTSQHLDLSFQVYKKLLDGVENNLIWKTVVCCEPQLGVRGLYPQKGGNSHTNTDVDALLQVLAYADGKTDLLSIADRHQRGYWDYMPAIDKLVRCGLLRKG